MSGPANRPADDASGKHFDDDGDINKALPGGDMGEIAHPQPVRAGCRKRAVYPVERACDGFFTHRGAQRLAAGNPS